ncbi:YigZ family protein [Clostridium sp. C105KSO13]|uniref:YigZ family protein n=1 Tax=Clostridium sp. C105KSO13 TaxID=1776045 RepID=UPI00074080D3|nr:YigZ family protein [Clostridium sp. C105KSO13]CUX28810.1 IMPACT family member YigZ [Clostridium sp. C105KSO13]
MDYKTVYQGGSAEIVEKKSRFIADVFTVTSEEEIPDCLEHVKKQYRDAKHHCWACIIGTAGMLERFSDDGEPGGTAGKPILEVLRGQNLCNVLIVVTRYFGGTLLGTGGLVRAYTAAACESLAHSIIITRIHGVKLKITMDYTELGKIQYFIADRGLVPLGTEYTEKVEMEIMVPLHEADKVSASIIDETNGKSDIRKEGEYWYAQLGTEIKTFEQAAQK